MAEGNDILGARIREQREALHLELKQLAAQCDLDPSVLSRIERAERGVNSVQLRRIAQALGVTMDSLFEQPSDPLALARAENDEITDMFDFGLGVIRDIEFVRSLDG